MQKRRMVCAAFRHGLPSPADKSSAWRTARVRDAVRKHRKVCAALRHGLPLPRGQERCVADGKSEGCGAEATKGLCRPPSRIAVARRQEAMRDGRQ